MLRVESVACGVDAVTSIDAVVEFMGRTTRNQVPDLVLGNQGMKETDCEWGNRYINTVFPRPLNYMTTTRLRQSFFESSTPEIPARNAAAKGSFTTRDPNESRTTAA